MTQFEQHEANLKQTLSFLASHCITAAALRDNADLYNTVAEAFCSYCEYGALRTQHNRSVLKSAQIETMDAVDTCAMRCLDQLDSILALPAGEQLRFLNTIIGNKLIDMARAHRRVYPKLPRSSTSFARQTLHADDDACEEEAQMFISFLDDTAWGYIHDKTDIAEDFISRKECDEVLSGLAASGMSAMDAYCFLSSIVLREKPSQIAAELIGCSLKDALERAVTEVSLTFHMDSALISALLCKGSANARDYSQSILEDVAAEVSRASYRAKNTLKKELCHLR